MAGRKHDIEIEIDAPADLVWKALTDADWLTRWFAPNARVTPGENGSVWLSWGPGMEGEARIVTWEPGRRFAWLEQENSSHPRVVDCLIETRDGRTVLRLVNSGFGEGADFDGEYESTHGGWHTFLAMMKGMLETHPTASTAKNVAILEQLPAAKAESWAAIRSALAIDTVERGARFEARMDDVALRGRVLAQPAIGYLALLVDQPWPSVLALFAEGSGPKAFLTIEWILFGEAVTQEATVSATLKRFASLLFPRA